MSALSLSFSDHPMGVVVVLSRCPVVRARKERGGKDKTIRRREGARCFLALPLPLLVLQRKVLMREPPLPPFALPPPPSSSKPASLHAYHCAT